jgi:hypothetical protein
MSEFTDLIGRPLAVGDYVAYDDLVFEIVRFTQKMVGLSQLGSRYSRKPLIYSSELVLLPPQDVTAWLLTKKV